MCGRTCLTLDPQQLICACKYTINDKKENVHKNESTSNEQITPEWRSEFNCGRKFVPSYNIAPTDITPVLVSAGHFSDENKEDINCSALRVVVPMMWGMIPFWHNNGDYRRHGWTTNNCRLEHMLESKLYHGPFRRGQRCVILCEGFYEWQTTKTAKASERAVHLIYMPQEKGVEIYDKSTWTPDNVKLLKMAGLFDVWTDENGDKMYSYSIITFESSELLTWMHHRTPAVLETEEQINNWLDFRNFSDEEALAALRQPTQLKWHRVSNLVNNSRVKSEQCNKPIELQSHKIKNSTMLDKWLIIRKRREEQLALIRGDDKNEDDKLKINQKFANSSDSETDDKPPAKRQRFRDFKKVRQQAQEALKSDNQTTTTTTTATSDESSSMSIVIEKN